MKLCRDRLEPAGTRSKVAAALFFVSFGVVFGSRTR
jgi:hypothetical protein